MDNYPDEQNNTIEPPVQTQKLEVSNDISINLESVGKWSLFLSILGFICIGFMVIAAIFVSIITSFIPTGTQLFPFSPILISLFYIIIALVYMLPVIYLYRFSNNIKRAILSKNQLKLSKAFKNLKAHYKSVGIICIIFICLYPILILGMFIFGFFSGVTGAETFPV